VRCESKFARFHFLKTKKPAQNNSVAGFTTRSLIPVVTTLGYQFIAFNKPDEERVCFSARPSRCPINSRAFDR
jgi:hypothetical protein